MGLEDLRHCLMQGATCRACFDLFCAVVVYREYDSTGDWQSIANSMVPLLAKSVRCGASAYRFDLTIASFLMIAAFVIPSLGHEYVSKTLDWP